MFTTDRATAHRVLATLTTVHPVDVYMATGQMISMSGVQHHTKAVREALEIIGTTDAADALPAPGRMASAGARQRIADAARFLAQYGM